MSNNVDKNKPISTRPRRIRWIMERADFFKPEYHAITRSLELKYAGPIWVEFCDYENAIYPFHVRRDT